MLYPAQKKNNRLGSTSYWSSDLCTTTRCYLIQGFYQAQPCLALIFVTDYYQRAIVKITVERSPLRKLNRFTIKVTPKDRFGRKLLRDFTMRPMVILKQFQSLMAVIRENLEWINNIVVTPQYEPN